MLVADEHTLNSQVINPFTGKPCRATLLGFLDWKSGGFIGYDIMLEECTQNIASALRNAILNLGKIPKFVYLDNGRAFRGKYFMGSANFNEIGLKGIYEKLGITTVFANPYNARAKVIERFFLEMQESFEKLLPSYIGTNIENKPARLRRNEKFHEEIHREFVPTIQQTIQMINSWLEYIVMFCDIDAKTAEGFIQKSENIKPVGNKFEYVETVRTEDKFKIIDKNIPCKNSDITVIDACKIFLKSCQNRDITKSTVKEYSL